MISWNIGICVAVVCCCFFLLMYANDLDLDWYVSDVVITIKTCATFDNWQQRYHYVYNFTFVRYWTKIPPYCICNKRTKCIKVNGFLLLLSVFEERVRKLQKVIWIWKKRTTMKFKVISLWQSKLLLPQLHYTSINQRCLAEMQWTEVSQAKQEVKANDHVTMY